MLTSIQTTILAALSAFMNGEHYQAPQDTDWKGLFKESIHQAVALSCLQGLEVATMPKEAQAAWQNYAMRSLQSNASVHAQHDYLHELMAKAEIPYTILKGSASAYYYADPLMRSMGDVDFYVADENILKTAEMLAENGFVQRDMKHLSHLIFNKEKIHLELHFKPAGLPEGEMGEIVKGYLADIYERGEVVEIDGSRFYKPSDFHHGLIILMHTYHHMLSEGIGLRHLCDWAAFVASFDSESFAEVFQEKLERVGLWRFAQILSATSYRYLGIPYRNWMGQVDEGLCENIILDIFAGGNFGEKDKERSVQGLSISDRGKGGVKKSKWAQFFASVNASAKVQFPRLAKIPILKYFCFIPLGCRYSFRVLTGKRKRLKFASNMKQAEERKQLYKQFELFEVKDNEYKNRL